jgi:2-succinyl-5-enolpyruvyl-6-hydroxy-3-cyclohexene-1-carboxylate synthase
VAARIVLSVPTADRALATADAQARFCATLVDQWVRDGVTHAMVAPGSRSTPMALAMAAERDLHVEVFHDERSAAFAALGAGMATGVPALLLCTSGTAATHFAGAVVEAGLSDVPMLVLTADRPPELRDVGAPQTIDQTKLYGDAVRWFHDPGVASGDTQHTWRSLARHAFARSVGTRRGPVHLNLPFREPLVGAAGDLPQGAPGRLVAEVPSVRLGTLAMQLDRERGVIVAGRGVDDPAAVAALSSATGWPVLADPRSGCRGVAGSVTAFDSLLRHEGFADSHVPEVVVHLGEPPASKVLSTWLATSGAVQVRVTATDTWIDPAHTVAHRLVAPIGEFCKRLAGELRGAGGSDWVQRWSHVSEIADRELARAVDGATSLTEPMVARAVSLLDDHVVVASSMPVRDLEWFGAPEQRATVWSNRGANGIDGTIATAIGIALASRRRTTVLLGDVAMLHDASSLTALVRRDVEVRIVVVDNDGGGIFSFLPQAAVLERDRFEQLFGTPHGTDLVALAAAHGLRATTVGDPAALRALLDEPGSQVIRVPSERTANVVEHARLHAAVTAAMRPG